MELRPSEAGRATSRGELRQERQYRVGVGTVGEPGERKEPAMPEPTSALYVGVDWGNQTHQVAVLDTARGLRGERGGAHDGPGLHAVASGLAERSEERRVGKGGGSRGAWGSGEEKDRV